MANIVLTLTVLPEKLAVCRLDAGEEIPAWALKSRYSSITRTRDELSIICEEQFVPQGVKCERDWRALRLEGPFDFNLVGVLASVLDPLAFAAISILAVGTYDTDYVLVREGHLERAVAVLLTAGHAVHREQAHL